MSGPNSTGRTPRWLAWTVLVTASLLLVGSAAYAASSTWQSTSVPGSAAARPTTARTAGAWPTAGRPTSYTVPSRAPGAARTAGRGGMMGSNRGGSMMDTVSGGNTVGMLSVNATTGAVWYHTWHGTYIAKEDA